MQIDVLHKQYIRVVILDKTNILTWWRHQMETFSVLLVLCAGISLVTITKLPSQRPVTWSFDVFFDLRQTVE